jgi:hypothetical protein
MADIRRVALAEMPGLFQVRRRCNTRTLCMYVCVCVCVCLWFPHRVPTHSLTPPPPYPLCPSSTGAPACA